MIKKAVESLSQKGFKAVSVKNAAEAVDYVLEQIKQTDTVGFGGSMTLFETGIADALVARGNTIYSAELSRRAGLDTVQPRHLALGADVFLTSTNAITLSGDLINIDGMGNRVAGMIFGPPKVIVVAGRNKLAANAQAAIARIKETACPKNARRLGLSTPCATEDRCLNCSNERRMCRVTVRHEYPPTGKDFHIVIIDGDFGY